MTLSRKSNFWRGLRDGMPFVIVIVPFAVLFGVAGTEAGLSIAQVMGFTIVVVAGAAQFTALQLMTEDAATIIVLATALVVNLRMAMYSAALAPHLGAAPFWQRAVLAYFNVDQTYTLSQIEFDRAPDQPLGAKIAYFMGVAAPLCPLWYLFTYVGAVAGSAIPPEFALDFAVPITFLALIAPALKTLAHVLAALTSIVVALALVWLPSGLGLIIAAAAAMIVGAQTELWLERRRA
ncbi:MAG: AzlC family ABC transporter permease [Rhodobacter sp.]|jgi:predicted branched-subunit amino acid permease|nr:AzlC family ABC transporter permease [Rhodobacter sp.]